MDRKQREEDTAMITNPKNTGAYQEIAHAALLALRQLAAMSCDENVKACASASADDLVCFLLSEAGEPVPVAL